CQLRYRIGTRSPSPRRGTMNGKPDVSLRRLLAIMSVLLFASCAGYCHQPSPQPQPVAKKDAPKTGRARPFNGANTSWRYGLDAADPPSLSSNKFLATKFFAGPTDIHTQKLELGTGLNSLTGAPGALCVAYDADHPEAE